MGASCPNALVGDEVPCDPGDHQVEARAPKHAPLTRRFALGEGELETFIVPVATPLLAPAQPVVLPAAARPALTSPARASSRRPWAGLRW